METFNLNNQQLKTSKINNPILTDSYNDLNSNYIFYGNDFYNNFINYENKTYTQNQIIPNYENNIYNIQNIILKDINYNPENYYINNTDIINNNSNNNISKFPEDKIHNIIKMPKDNIKGRKNSNKKVKPIIDYYFHFMHKN